MIKKVMIICMLFALGTTAAIAQKFGHIDSTTLLQDLPETQGADKKLEQEQGILRLEVEKMQKNLQAQYAEFEKLAPETPEVIRRNRINDIQALEQSLQEFAAEAERNLSEVQQNLYQPIIDKVKVAIEAVGKENGFTYIFDTSSGAIVYEGGEDITSLVKTKLGL